MSSSIWTPPGGYGGPHLITLNRAVTTLAENAALVTEQHLRDRARYGPDTADCMAAERLARGHS